MQNINISGQVIKEDGYGKVLGFPTANLDRRNYVRQKKKIRFGIWAGVVKFKIKKFVLRSSKDQKLKIYPAGIVIGPLDKKSLPKIEAHLIGFKGNLYGRKITINLLKYLRPFRVYKSHKELKFQIIKDIKVIKKLNLKLKFI